MNAGSTRHLRQALYRAFDLLAGNHHQVGDFVHHHDDERHVVQFQNLVLVNRLASLAVKAGLHRALEDSRPFPWPCGRGR